MVENRCYDADCDDEDCRNPKHYNYICFDPECEDTQSLVCPCKVSPQNVEVDAHQDS